MQEVNGDGQTVTRLKGDSVDVDRPMIASRTAPGSNYGSSVLPSAHDRPAAERIEALKQRLVARLG